VEASSKHKLRTREAICLASGAGGRLHDLGLALLVQVLAPNQNVVVAIVGHGHDRITRVLEALADFLLHLFLRLLSEQKVQAIIVARNVVRSSDLQFTGVAPNAGAVISYLEPRSK